MCTGVVTVSAGTCLLAASIHCVTFYYTPLFDLKILRRALYDIGSVLLLVVPLGGVSSSTSDVFLYLPHGTASGPLSVPANIIYELTFRARNRTRLLMIAGGPIGLKSCKAMP